MSDDVNTLIAHQNALADDRLNFDAWWQQIALRVMPRDAQFTVESVPGEHRTERLFTGKPVTANERFGAVLEDLLTPRTQSWNDLKPEESSGPVDQASKVALEQVNNVIRAMRNRPKANFASQRQQGYLSVGAFGNSCLLIDEVVGDGARYKHIHMREVFWAEDQHGQIDTLYRRFKWEARKAYQRFGDKLPEKIRTAAEKKPFDKFEFIHCVRPNEERKASRADYRGMPWSSYYLALDGKQMLDVGGYTSWPYAIGRYQLAPGEVYGRSPAMSCWPAILTLNEEKKTILRAGQKDVDPPTLLTEDGALEPFNLQSGALNYGLVSPDGTPLAVPYKTGANIPLGLELMTLEAQDIDDAFLTAVFQILVQNPQMTATQVLEIVQQRGVLLAPTMGRFQSEDLGPQIQREIDIAAKAGLLPELPEALIASGGRYRIEYTSPLARAQRASDALAITRTMELAGPAIALDPKAKFVLDVPASLREVAEINGVPAKLIRDDEAIAELAGQEQQAAAAMQIAAAAPGVSQAALNAAKAEQLRTG